MPVLSELFGECPQVKILEAFAENKRGMLYIADIIRITNLSKMTVNNYIRKLLDEGIIQKTEKAGKIQYYELNHDNSKARTILAFVRYIEDKHLEEPIKQNIVNDDVSTSAISNNNNSMLDSSTYAYFGYEPMTTTTDTNNQKQEGNNPKE